MRWRCSQYRIANPCGRGCALPEVEGVCQSVARMLQGLGIALAFFSMTKKVAGAAGPDRNGTEIRGAGSSEEDEEGEQEQEEEVERR